jgi:hypothetical protein
MFVDVSAFDPPFQEEAVFFGWNGNSLGVRQGEGGRDFRGRERKKVAGAIALELMAFYAMPGENRANLAAVGNLGFFRRRSAILSAARQK